MKKTNTYYDDNKNIVFKQYAKNREIYFNNEITCLKLLKNNFNNKHYNNFPFPIIQDINYNTLSFNMKYCGETINKKHNKSCISVESQLKNIFFNLKKCNILYKDIHPENVCLNNGDIYLIDFEVAFIMNFEKYENVISFKRGGYKWSDEYYNNYYNMPQNLDIYNNLNFNSEKREWKGKPWSIYRMSII